MKSYGISVYQCVPIGRKIVLKLLDVYVTACLFRGKLYESCRTWKSLRTLTKVSCVKVAECEYLCVLMPREAVLNLQNVYFTAQSYQVKFC